jgi:stress-induced morphogen
LLLSEHNKIAAIEHQLSQEKLEKEKFHNILQELNNISPANDNPKSKVLENLVMQLEITPDDCTQSQTTAAILIETTNQLAATTIAEPSSYIVKYEPGVKLNFNCGICQKDFNQRSDLQRHINEIHGSTENFQCNICSKKFKVLRYLKDHQDQVHYKKKIYKCSICNKKFTTKSLRDLHRRKCNNK